MDVCVIVREDLYQLKASEKIDSALNESDVHSLFTIKGLKAEQDVTVTVLYVTNEMGNCIQQLKAFGADRILRLRVADEVLTDEVRFSQAVSRVLQDESFAVVLLGETTNNRDMASVSARIGAHLQLESFGGVDDIQLSQQKVMFKRTDHGVEESFVYSDRAVVSLKQVPGFTPLVTMWEIFKEYDVEVVDLPVETNVQGEGSELIVHSAKDAALAQRKLYNDENPDVNVKQFVKDFTKDLHI